jgi:hypothetical protein
MPTESFLWRVSRRLCNQQAWEMVIEPLLADLAFDLARTRTRLGRIAVLTRWSVAVGQALLLCGFRSGVTWLSTLSSDRERVIIWSYSIGILLVVGVGPQWVRTGEVSLIVTLRSLSKLVPLLPWAIYAWGTMYGAPPPTGARAVRRALGRTALMFGLLTVTWWLNPRDGESMIAIAVGNLVLVMIGRRFFARQWESVPEGRRIGEMGNHPSIKG